MSRKHMAYSAVGMVNRRGQQNALSVMFMGRAKRFQTYRSQFLPNSTDSLCLQVTWIPRSQDLAIFIPMTTDKNDCFTPCTCTWGKKSTVDSTCTAVCNVLAMSVNRAPCACAWHWFCPVNLIFRVSFPLRLINREPVTKPASFWQSARVAESDAHKPYLNMRNYVRKLILSNFTVDLSFLQCNQPLNKVLRRASFTRLSGESGRPQWHHARAHSAFVPHIARTLQTGTQCTGCLRSCDCHIPQTDHFIGRVFKTTIALLAHAHGVRWSGVARTLQNTVQRFPRSCNTNQKANIMCWPIKMEISTQTQARACAQI